MITDTERPQHMPTPADFPQLPSAATKQEEIDHVGAFVASLPEGSYLASLLVDLPTLCAEEIRNDWAFPVEIHKGWRERVETQRRIEEDREQYAEERKKREHEDAQLARERKRVMDAIDNLYDEGIGLARLIADYRRSR